ncbi:MAG: hypothetical protein LQ346_008677 [Caloplaca aetnensis]|nr:MAG: hypothetical protein LQ346_008677 [Caloplaca aetnensis]
MSIFLLRVSKPFTMKFSSSLFVGLVSLATVISALPTAPVPATDDTAPHQPVIARAEAASIAKRGRVANPHWLKGWKAVDDSTIEDVAGTAIAKRGRVARAETAIEAALAAAIAGSHRTERPESTQDESTENAAGAAVAKRGRGAGRHRVEDWEATRDTATASASAAAAAAAR